MLPFSSFPRSETRFWLIQLGVWSAYGVVLMLPWIGTYTVASMIPTKVALGGTALLISSALRLFYDLAFQRSVRADRMILLVMIGSLAAGLTWSILSALMISGGGAMSVRPMGVLEGDIPLLAGPVYHAVVMAAWSLGYLALKMYTPVRAETVPDGETPVPRTSEIATAADGRLVARDGNRSIVLGRDEIDWVQAEGDYVRLYADRRSFLIRSTMSRIEKTLPPGDYIRIHRSTIVNVARVREVATRSHAELLVVLGNGTKLKASRNYAERLRVALRIRSKQSGMTRGEHGGTT